MSTRTIRVLVTDDHPVVRRSLSMFLATHDNLLVVGEAADGVEALQLCQDLSPDVILLDIAMPRLNGLEAIPVLRQTCPEAKIIVLSGAITEEIMGVALEAGAARCLSKHCSGAEIAQIIHELIP